MDHEATQSHKGEKIKSYTLNFKLEAVKFAELNGNRCAARKFNVDVRRIREWRNKKEQISEQCRKPHGKQRKMLDGTGRKPAHEVVENKVLEWIYDRREKNLRVSCILIMKKAKIIFDSTQTSSETSESFVASRGWLRNFMRRHGLSLRRRTSIAQKDPEQLIGKLVSYVIHARRLQMKFNFEPSQIYAMDETPVWQDMVGTTTVTTKGNRDVVLKSTGHEKARVSVCLTARADGQKMKPFIVFKGAKHEVSQLNKEFHGKCFVASSENGWMNTHLTNEFVQNVLGSLSFSKRLLVWDTYECHMEGSLSKSLKQKKIESLLIPGGCTKYIQAPDVSWNKPFKAKVSEEYDEWLSTDGINNLTDAGNLKSPPRHVIVKWILKAWEKLTPELISKSFKACASNILIDGSEDDTIHCFKAGQPCEKGFPILKDQLPTLNEPETNPFTVIEGQSEEEVPSFILVDEDEEGDADIEI